MGFFNKILKGLGFEDEEVEAPKKQKLKGKKPKKETVVATYNLNEFENTINKKTAQIKDEKTEQIDEINKTPELEFELVKVKSQTDIQMVVDKLKGKRKVLLNVDGLSSADLVRSLDFVTGAVYALDLNMQKVDDNLYLIQVKN